MTQTVTVLSERFALRRGVSRARSADGTSRLFAWPHAESIGRLSPGEQAVLRRLAEGRHTEADLVGYAAAEHGDDGVPELIAKLRAGGWLKTTVSAGDRELFTLVPLRPAPASAGGPPVGALRLSRFTMVRRQATGMVVESPRSWCEIEVHDPAILALLGAPDDPSVAPDLPVEAADRFVAELRRAAMAVTDADGEETDLRLRQWSPHELWFHDHSRLRYRGYFGDDFGGTFWARGTFAPVPARPEPYPGPVIALPEPDLAVRRQADPPLAAVMEDRRSVRAYDDDHPIRLDQLAELLYRCARTRLIRENDGVEYTSRPHPAGGSVYELETYLVVRHADGLAPGMYHYDAVDHQLRLVRGPHHPAVRKLVMTARHGSAEGISPQAMLVISARFGRLMWKYQEMPYALVLKHVGVLYQSLYLAATAMGLAPCGLGSGDSVAFAEATGRDELVECSVGEFLIGSRPAVEGATR